MVLLFSIAVLLLLALFAPWSRGVNGLIQVTICLFFVLMGIAGANANHLSDPDVVIYVSGAVGWGMGLAAILLFKLFRAPPAGDW